MKIVLTFCIGILTPCSFLLAQKQIQNPVLLQPTEKPYLISDNKSLLNEKIVSFYNNYNRLMKSYKGQTNAELPIKQKLDSIISIPTDSTLTPQKSAYKYNNNGQITSSAEYAWDHNTKTWFNVSKIEWSYNAKYFNTSFITYYGDSLKWYNELKYENIYDANNRLITVNGYGWNDSSNQWDLGSKIENSYNANGLLTVSITSIWNTTTSKWELYYKSENQYDNDDNLAVTIYYQWQQPKWNFLQRDSFDYYFSKQLNHYYYDVWDGSGDWGKYSQTEFIYNFFSDLLTVKEYLWDVISVIYVNSRKTDYKYDTGNNLTQAVFSKWVKQLQNFILEAKEDCTFDYNYLHADLVIPPNMKFSKSTRLVADNDIYFGHELTKQNLSLHNGAIYVANNSRTFYWSPISITKTADKESASEVDIVPNPARDHFTISNKASVPMDFQLMDITGKVLMAKKIYSSEMISTESLTKGMYLYRVLSNNKNLQSGKLVVN
jgi:hypothetical protein